MATRDEFVQKLKDKLDEWNESINELTAKAGQARDDVKASYEQRLVDLRKQHEAVKQQVQGAREASQDSWGDLKTGLEGAASTLSESLKKARSHFS